MFICLSVYLYQCSVFVFVKSFFVMFDGNSFEQNDDRKAFYGQSDELTMNKAME